MYILWTFRLVCVCVCLIYNGYLVYFSLFGMLYVEKSGNPAPHTNVDDEAEDEKKDVACTRREEIGRDESACARSDVCTCAKKKSSAASSSRLSLQHQRIMHTFAKPRLEAVK
jgi:hypothetical protein